MTLLVALCAALSIWNLSLRDHTSPPPPSCAEASTDSESESESEAWTVVPVTRETDRIYVGF